MPRKLKANSRRPVIAAIGLAIIAAPATAQVTPGPLCYADCDRATGAGTLDIFDFLCFQDKFVSGDAYADCDGSQSLDIFDFLCFQDAFIQGCPDFRINPPGTDPTQCEEATTSSQCRTIGMPEPLLQSVHLFSGEFHTTVEDMRIRGRGFDFVWQRTYRSFAGPRDSRMGDRGTTRTTSSWRPAAPT